jgi:hypothetical protein
MIGNEPNASKPMDSPANSKMSVPSTNTRLAGGIWDKLGNRYESLWTVDAQMRVLAGEILELVVEPHGEAGQGVEFYTVAADGTREYFSAKRQKSGNAWSLADLSRADETGRSILGDLLQRISTDVSARAVFASGTSASKLNRLCNEAETASSAKDFETNVRACADLADELETHVLKKFKLDWTGAWERLRRLRVDGCNEATLRRLLERVVERDLVQNDGTAISSTAARLVLYELVYSSFSHAIRRDAIIAHLGEHRMAPRDWTRPGSDHDEIERRNRLYTEGVEVELIRGEPVIRAEANAVDAALDSGAKVVVLTGSAGLGKSCVLAQCLRAFQGKGVPCLALRLDAQTSANTATALGKDLGLSLSPAVVLSGVARGRPSVLIVDQLDALSTASGRNPRLWEAFQDLLFEVQHLKSIRVILACRTYDLENDDRLRDLVRKHAPKNPPIKLEPLSVELVRSLLTEAGAALDKFHPRHIEFLRIPLHLNVFLRGNPKIAEPANDLTTLYDRYWEAKANWAAQHQPREVLFSKAVSRLAQILSDRQSLTAPKDVFDADNLGADAAALASGHVLVFDSGRYRFFHETFFDYVFARSFVSAGKKVVPDLLTPTEQHLFRRGQVRQVLAYQRRRDGSYTDYLENLRDLLLSEKVRTHVKKTVIDWLRELADPEVEEWSVVRELCDHAHLGWFTRTVVWNKPAWFPVLEKTGTWDYWLTGNDGDACNLAIRLLALPETIKVHSAAIARLMRAHLRDTSEWRDRLAGLCQFGEIYHSPEFFGLFLEKFRDGWFDQKLNRHLHLTKVAEENPTAAGKTIAVFLERRFPSCVEEVDSDLNAPAVALHLDSHFFTVLAQTDPLPVLREVLPTLVSILRTHAQRKPDGRVVDPLGSHLILDEPYRFGDVLIRYLIDAMRRVAKERPAELAILTRELVALPNETAAILLESTWTANGVPFASDVAGFLRAFPEHLDLELHHNSDGESLLTVSLLAGTTEHMSAQDLRGVEELVLQFKDSWEQRNRAHFGFTQYRLLTAFPESRLSPEGWQRLDELRRKFGPIKHGVPRSLGAEFVPSPISFECALKMSDRHWLSAMRQYSEDWNTHIRRGGRLIGGSVELSRVLEKVAQADKPRFARLLQKLPDDINSTYFEHLLSGLCRTASENDKERIKLPPAAFASLATNLLIPCFERVDRLPGKPCGKQICWSAKSIADRPHLESLVTIIAYYAKHAPDPEVEVWQASGDGKTPMYGGDPHFHGINSARGAAAETISQLLFGNPELLTMLDSTIETLANDRSMAVRSCAIGCLIFLLREHRDVAVQRFFQAIKDADQLLTTHYVEEFIHYAQFTHYAALRPLLVRMLGLPDEKARAIAARQITLAGFKHAPAHSDMLEFVLKGDEVCRAAAAGIFAHNLAESEWAPKCREFLNILFQDPAGKVIEQADHCWRRIDAEQLADESDLLNSFIESPALTKGVDSLLAKLEECPLRLPDIVLRIPERLIEERKRLDEKGTDRLDMSFYNASKMIMTAYQQSRSHDRGPAATAYQTRCLNLIDNMLLFDHGSMETELKKLDES